jgi:anaerobic nitric oxide reductase flavorubredoxin
MSILVKNNIHWVGQRDWEVRDFHGTEYKTLRGSSYNSYLIREEKNVLIDTVDHKFSREFVQNLRSEIDLADLDYIIINHAEEDHAGALTELMCRSRIRRFTAPPTPSTRSTATTIIRSGTSTW